MSTGNSRNVSPVPGYPERGRQVYDEILAQPKVNAMGERAGERWAQEGLDETMASPFLQAQDDARSGASHRSYDAVIGGQANGRTSLGGVNPPPAWDGVDAATRRGFLDGTAGEEISANWTPHPWAQRPGANPNPAGPTHAFNFGERPNTVYQSKVAPVDGGRGHMNVADRTEF